MNALEQKANFELREYEGMQFPYTQDTTILGAPVPISDSRVVLKNSISTHPMEAVDCNEDGSPSEFSFHRGERLAKSGAGLIWTEAMAVQEDGKSNSHSQWITDANVDGYKRLIDRMKAINPDAVIVAQLTHSGRFSKPHNVPEPVIALNNPHYTSVPMPADYPVVCDDYLDRVNENFAHAALLCQQAGFDGVDVKCCHGYLFSDLLSCYDRPGKYGGSYENRTRLLLETIENVRSSCNSDFLTGCRYAFADTIPYPYGFGMKHDGSLEYDLTESIQLARDMYTRGVRLLDVSVGKLNMNPAFTNGMFAEKPIDSAVQYFNRFYHGTKALHEALPEMVIIGSDYSAFKGDAAYVAAGAFAQNAVTMVGFGKNALAYEGFASDMVNGSYDPKKACVNCGNCSKLLRSIHPCGCPVHDQEMYLPLLKSLA